MKRLIDCCCHWTDLFLLIGYFIPPTGYFFFLHFGNDCTKHLSHFWRSSWRHGNVFFLWFLKYFRVCLSTIERNKWTTSITRTRERFEHLLREKSVSRRDKTGARRIQISIWETGKRADVANRKANYDIAEKDEGRRFSFYTDGFSCWSLTCVYTRKLVVVEFLSIETGSRSFRRKKSLTVTTE